MKEDRNIPVCCGLFLQTLTRGYPVTSVTPVTRHVSVWKIVY